MTIRSGTELINPFKLLERIGIRDGFHVADLGCGALGHFVLPAAQLVGPRGIVYAVDIQRSVLEQVEKLAREQQIFHLKPIWSDIDVYGATRIPAASLDLTLLINNLWLSQNRPQLVREMARLTKLGAAIVIVEWKVVSMPLGPPPHQRLDPEEAKRLLQTPLMEFREAVEVGAYHYGLVYERTNQAP